MIQLFSRASRAAAAQAVPQAGRAPAAMSLSPVSCWFAAGLYLRLCCILRLQRLKQVVGTLLLLVCSGLQQPCLQLLTCATHSSKPRQIKQLILRMAGDHPCQIGSDSYVACSCADAILPVLRLECRSCGN